MKTHIYYRDEIKASIAGGVLIAALCGHTQVVAGAPTTRHHRCRRCLKVLAKIRPGETALPFRSDGVVCLSTVGMVTTWSWTAENSAANSIPPAA